MLGKGWGALMLLIVSCVVLFRFEVGQEWVDGYDEVGDEFALFLQESVSFFLQCGADVGGGEVGGFGPVGVGEVEEGTFEDACVDKRLQHGVAFVVGGGWRGLRCLVVNVLGGFECVGSDDEHCFVEEYAAAFGVAGCGGGVDEEKGLLVDG